MASLEGRKVKHGTTWRVIYYLNGKQEKLKIGFTSRRIALQRKAQIETLLALGKNPQGSVQRYADVSLSQLLERDVEWCASRKRPRTIEINSQAVKKLIGWAGDVSISKVDRGLIEQYLNHLRDGLHHSGTSVNMYLRQLKALFQRAVEEYGLLNAHPFRSIKPFAVSRQTRKAIFLTVDQVGELLNSIDDIHLKRIVQFYLWTGCRRIEATELVWSDIDWLGRQIYLGHPDSQTKLRRVFPMTDRLKRLLEELHTDQNDNERVFWRFAHDERLLSKRIRNIRRHISGLPDNLTLHTLRHSFASHLVMSGIDLLTVATFLGHSTSRVTEMYAHLQPDHKRAAADRLPY